MWLMNGIIIAVVLARLFVFGEPITKPLSESSVTYWRNRKQADSNLARVSCGDTFPLHTQSIFLCEMDVNEIQLQYFFLSMLPSVSYMSKCTIQVINVAGPIR